MQYISRRSQEENGQNVQEGTEDDNHHEYEESESEKRVLRTSEGEVHDFDRPGCVSICIRALKEGWHVQ
jgi:hypothetical protein